MAQEKYTTSLQSVEALTALEWLERGVFPGQRPLRLYHAEFLARLMRRGQFIQGTQIHIVVLGKYRYLVNGQHTLKAVTLAQRPVLLNVLETQVETLQEAQDIYMAHDRGLQRSLTDCYGVMEVNEGLHMTAREGKALGSAMQLLAAGFLPLYGAHSSSQRGIVRGAMRDGHTRWAFMSSWLPECHEYLEAVSGCAAPMKNALLRAPAMAVALVTFRFQPVDSAEFWRSVAHGTAAVPHPARALYEFLLGRPGKLYRGDVYARYVARAWNADYTDRTLKVIHTGSTYAADPIVIEGTPYTKNAVMGYITEEWNILSEPMRVLAVQGEGVEASAYAA